MFADNQAIFQVDLHTGTCQTCILLSNSSGWSYKVCGYVSTLLSYVILPTVCVVKVVRIAKLNSNLFPSFLVWFWWFWVLFFLFGWFFLIACCEAPTLPQTLRVSGNLSSCWKVS